MRKTHNQGGRYNRTCALAQAVKAAWGLREQGLLSPWRLKDRLSEVDVFLEEPLQWCYDGRSWSAVVKILCIKHFGSTVFSINQAVVLESLIYHPRKETFSNISKRLWSVSLCKRMRKFPRNPTALSFLTLNS